MTTAYGAEFARRVASIISRISDNCSGNVVMIFALSLIPLFAVAGFAIDNNRHISAEKKVQASLDAAALATTLRFSEERLDPTKLSPIAQFYFDAQLEKSAAMKLQPVKATIVDGEVILSAQGTLDTTLMGIIGQDTMVLDASSSVIYKIQQPVELALVLDTSESMKGSKLTALKSASRSLVDILLPFEDPDRNDAAKMSIIPFNDYVKIDTKYKNASWIRETESYTRTWESCSVTNAARREAGCYRESYSCTRWRGSVEAGNRESYRTTCRRWKCPAGAEPEKKCRTRSEFRLWYGCVRSRRSPHNV